MRICFATNNKNKLREIKSKLGEAYDIISLSDLGHTEELSETHDTLEGNSLEKALFIHEKYQVNCFLQKAIYPNYLPLVSCRLH